MYNTVLERQCALYSYTVKYCSTYLYLYKLYSYTDNSINSFDSGEYCESDGWGGGAPAKEAIARLKFLYYPYRRNFYFNLFVFVVINLIFHIN